MSKTMRAIEAYSQAELDAMDQMEAALRAQYPTRGIVEGSILAPDCSDNPFPGKYSVEITCVDCGAVRRVATQDLFQVSRCKACTERARKVARAAKRAAKRAASLTPEAQLESVERKLAELAKLKAELEAAVDAVDTEETEQQEETGSVDSVDTEETGEGGF